MSKKFTYEFVKNTIEENGDTLLSETYEGCNQKLKIRCKNNHIFTMTFTKYKLGRRCRTCHIESTRTSAEDAQEYLDIYLSGYLLDKNTYKSANEKSDYYCDKLHKFKSSLHNLKLGHKCPICFKENREGNKKYAQEIFSEDGYEIIGEYVNHTEKTQLKCPNGHEVFISLTKYKQGQRCKYCQHQSMKYDLQFVKDYYAHFGYTFLDNEYIGRDYKHNILCPNKHKIKMSFSAFKSTSCRCPLCKCSNGEADILYFLNQNNVDYIYQHKYDGCRDINPLPFDFYIPSKNILIEYDGEQHFKPNTKFGIRSFNICKKHDKIKTEYCIKNKIKLLRIPYWDFDDIENILHDNNII